MKTLPCFRILLAASLRLTTGRAQAGNKPHPSVAMGARTSVGERAGAALAHSRLLLALVLLGGFSLPPTTRAEERFLLAADTQVIEVNRAGHVTECIAGRGHSGIYEAWRLPDGGIAYAHRGGLAVFDAEQRLQMAHSARKDVPATEANSCVVLEGGAQFALMDSGAGQIRVVDRAGNLLSETPVPGLEEVPVHMRYRTIRAVPNERAFWVAQYSRKTLLKVEQGTGRLIESLNLDTLLAPKKSGPVFGVTALPGGALWVATSTGKQLALIGPNREVARLLTAESLGLTCRYLLGTQQLPNGHLMVACGDYHMKAAEEGQDVLAELDEKGAVVWRLTRAQLVDQVAGFVDARTGLEEMRVTHVHAYDHERLDQTLNVLR